MKKLSIKLLATAALLFTATVATMAQGSFAYQAVIRDGGSLVSNKDVNLKFTLFQGTTNYYAETQKTKTNEYGNISVMVGSGTKVEGDFMSVPWSSMNVMLKIEVDAKGGNNFTDLGSIQLQPVPYALYAKETSKVKAQATANDDEAIFEVKDSQGNLVFAVYPDGVKVFVDDTDADKARRSGFIVTGRTATKGEETSDYFTVTADGTQVIVDDAEDGDKARRSGFIVTGRTATKDADNDYLKIDGEGTRVYVDVDDTDKARRSGFIVTGRTATKGETTYDDVFKIDSEGTQVIIDDTDNGDKARRSGFIVTGRTATKGDDATATKYVDVNGESIEFSSSSFNVSDKKTSNKVLAVTNGNVHVNSDLLLTGDIVKKFDGVVKALTTDTTITITASYFDEEVTYNDLFENVEGYNSNSQLYLIGMTQEGVYTQCQYNSNDVAYLAFAADGDGNAIRAESYDNEHAAVVIWLAESLYISHLGTYGKTLPSSIKFAVGFENNGEVVARTVIVNFGN